MARRIANLPSGTASVSESIQRVEPQKAGVSGRISLRVSREELDQCVANQKHALALIIRDKNAPPVDGGIMRIGAALDLLARIDPEIDE